MHGIYAKLLADAKITILPSRKKVGNSENWSWTQVSWNPSFTSCISFIAILSQTTVFSYLLRRPIFPLAVGKMNCSLKCNFWNEIFGENEILFLPPTNQDIFP